MKTLKKLLPMLLACTFAFSACVGGTPTTSTGGDSSVDSSSTGGNTSVEVQDNVIINGTTPNITPSNPQKEKEEHFQTENVLHKVNVTETDRPFIVNRKSEYKVLLPANASPDIKTAAAYFVKYVSQATGYYLPTESADSYTWDEDAKWIVFGRTELFQAAGLTMPVDDIGQSGYYIKSAGDSVFLAVKEDFGWQRAALALLRHTVGYEMYWNDTVVFEKTGETLPDMDIIERPDFDFYIESNKLEGDGRYGMGFNTSPFIPVEGAQQHNTFIYLPKSTYQSVNPEWYSISDIGAGSGSGSQLCYTARGNEEKFNLMVATMAERVIHYMEGRPDLVNITITHEDVRSTCGCSACVANYEKYGAYSASIILFMNAVDDIIQDYLQDKADKTGTEKKQFNIIFFGYGYSEAPPVKKDANGNYVATAPEVVCNPNVGVYIAPIRADFQHSFYEAENVSAAENIKGWAAICETLYMWLYDTNYLHYFFPFNTWDSKIETYRFCKEYGTYFMMNQSQYNQGAVTHFSRFKDYIDAKASFDVNVDLGELTDDFFKNYYGPAEAPMRKMFNLLQARMRYLAEKYPIYVYGFQKENIAKAEFWPRQTLAGYMSIIEEAYEALESIKTSDPEMYEVYREHVLLESMFPRFALLTFYSGTFTSEEFYNEAYSFKQDCLSFGIGYSVEWVTLDSYWLDWGV